LELPLDERSYQAIIDEGIVMQQASLEKFVGDLSEFL